MSFGGPGTTWAVTSGGGWWQRWGAGLGVLSLLGKKDDPTPSAHPTHPWGICPTGQLTSYPLSLPPPLNSSPVRGQALGEKLRGGAEEDGDKSVHTSLLCPPPSLLCASQGLPESPQGLGFRTLEPGLPTPSLCGWPGKASVSSSTQQGVDGEA